MNLYKVRHTKGEWSMIFTTFVLAKNISDVSENFPTAVSIKIKKENLTMI